MRIEPYQSESDTPRQIWRPTSVSEEFLGEDSAHPGTLRNYRSPVRRAYQSPVLLLRLESSKIAGIGMLCPARPSGEAEVHGMSQLNGDKAKSCSDRETSNLSRRLTGAEYNTYNLFTY